MNGTGAGSLRSAGKDNKRNFPYREDRRAQSRRRPRGAPWCHSYALTIATPARMVNATNKAASTIMIALRKGHDVHDPMGVPVNE